MPNIQIHASVSEDNGISKLGDTDLAVYSVGISTGGVAEIRMAQANPKRHIVATTIDRKGADFAQEYIKEQGLERRIKVKIEDVTKPLSYDDNSFDYVYARLVLHYLPEQGLVDSLSELYRILRPGGKIYIVVRSTKCPSALRPDARFDPVTHFTTYIHTDKVTGSYPQSRFFHTEESISKYVAETGFSVDYVKAYDEQLFVDFMRTVKSSKPDNVIELLAVRPIR